MSKIIWSIWFQGRQSAPFVVRECLESWERKNPGWELRCLDASTVLEYIPLDDFIDLNKRVITFASLSDIIRILLLREYGGVWVDATVYCNQPLDDWLTQSMTGGFFAFSSPASDRPLSSWFLSAVPGNQLVLRWCASTLRYWRGRTRADHYFWFHYLFRDLCEDDGSFAAAWGSVKKISALGPHSLQAAGLCRPENDVADDIDWLAPVFKLTHRIEQERVLPGTLLHGLLHRVPTKNVESASGSNAFKKQDRGDCFASLSVNTDNVGDHIQIIGCNALLKRFGVVPNVWIDRDDEIRSVSKLSDISTRVPIVLNGWFKRNGAEWPPSEKLTPLFLGFHIRHFQCPELVSAESIAYLQKFQPIGCRDPFTSELLNNKGLVTYVSGCLSLTMHTRFEQEAEPTDIIVVSRDGRLLELLPSEQGPYRYINHYTGSTNFSENMEQAKRLLELYRSNAKLIITSMLHCALPAIAMGIPVIVFYPINDEFGHQSDKERFSHLDQLTRIYTVDEMADVDWNPKPVDVSQFKIDLHDRIESFLSTLGYYYRRPIGPIALSSELPPP